MANEQHELRRINWTEVFSFTHIFKSFKMAIHPSKLALSLVVVVLIFCTGTVLDWIWDAAGQHVYPNEIHNHFAKASWQFENDKELYQDQRIDRAVRIVANAESQKYHLDEYISMLNRGHLKDAFEKVLAKRNEGLPFRDRSAAVIKKDKSYSELLGKAESLFADEIKRIRKYLPKAKKQAKKNIAAIADKQQRQTDKDKLAEDFESATRSITLRKVRAAGEVRKVRGGSIFVSLMNYELQCLSNALTAVRYGNIFGGLQGYRSILRQKTIPALSVQFVQGPTIPSAIPANDRAGFIYLGLLGVHAVFWLICEHWVYALIFLVISLAVVAIFGGAVHRIAALHFAKEEKISIVQALKFSFSKFFSFFTAPLIPVAIIVILGLFLTLAGLFGSIPLIGNIVMGVLFFLTILIGLAIAFLLVGLLGGFPLMYPTIAVEGSDSFDAISRSFSYVFARPWRAAMYGLVAMIYGTVTYLFVRFFAFLALASTHYFVKWGVIGGGSRLHPSADKLDVMWNTPTFESLFGPFNWEAMTGAMPVGAWLIGMWVFLVAAGVLAFLLSYVGSSTTIIYYLLRQQVDATDLDDVYVEEEDEEEDLLETEEETPEAKKEEAPPTETQGEGQAKEE